jgi:hypothetical protein
MAKIRIEHAPPPRVPLRFFLTAPVWGVIAGAMLIVGGEQLLLSRWAPATLALVHALTLGVLGNAMMGSLLQFLPAAAGVTPRGGPGAAYLLHALLNAGTAALLSGFWRSEPSMLRAAAVLLVGAFVLLAAITLPGLLRAASQRVLTIGIAFSVLCGAGAAGLGARMALGLAGDGAWGLPLLPWADLHAAWGVLGWVIVLLASVGQVVMPMFQGTAATRPGVVVGWLATVAAGLAAASAMAPRDGGEALRWIVSLGTAAFAGEALWRQMRRTRSGESTLLRGWRIGLVALAVAALLLPAGVPAVMIGTLVLAIALPLLVISMQLEIVAFLGWIGMRRRVPCGTRIPGVQHLLPSRQKGAVLAAFCLSGAALVLAAAWPQPVLARIAGGATAGAHLALLLVLAGVGMRCRRLQPAAQASA